MWWISNRPQGHTVRAATGTWPLKATVCAPLHVCAPLGQNSERSCAKQRDRTPRFWCSGGVSRSIHHLRSVAKCEVRSESFTSHLVFLPDTPMNTIIHHRAEHGVPTSKPLYTIIHHVTGLSTPTNAPPSTHIHHVYTQYTMYTPSALVYTIYTVITTHHHTPCIHPIHH
jgi:hypothetical protein